MGLLIVITLAALAFAAVRFGLVPPLGARTLVYIRGSAIDVRRGTLRGLAREHLSDIARDAGVRRGFIAVTSANRVWFSAGIPVRFRQQMRNVLFSQWG